MQSLGSDPVQGPNGVSIGSELARWMAFGGERVPGGWSHSGPTVFPMSCTVPGWVQVAKLLSLAHCLGEGSKELA